MTLKHRIILIVINDRIKVKQFSYKIYSLNNYGYLATEFIKKNGIENYAIINRCTYISL